jgi:hypothetical protein
MHVFQPLKLLRLKKLLQQPLQLQPQLLLLMQRTRLNSLGRVSLNKARTRGLYFFLFVETL